MNEINQFPKTFHFPNCAQSVTELRKCYMKMHLMEIENWFSATREEVEQNGT